jgi:hypothetical protein
MITPRIIAAVTGLVASCASAQSVVWSNVANYPQDLINTGDAWSAIRSEPPNFVSYRCAADDFILNQKTTITQITFYSVEIDPPSILGGDWYIYEIDPATGLPGTLIAYQDNEPLTRTPTGHTSPIFGVIYANVMQPQGLTLPAGNYYLAFRTYQDLPANPVGKPNNAALSTRVMLGTRTAHWNFQVDAHGNVGDQWVPMSVFNLVNDQAWAFIIEGVTACYPDCDGSGSLDLFDFLCFTNAFNNNDPYADCDGSGGLDLFDFLCFTNAFNVGCP